jgi:pantothenate kinase type III
MIESTSNILAIEVGSSRVKLGWFPAAGACASEKPAGNLPIAAPLLPEPSEVFWIDHRHDEHLWLREVESHLADLSPTSETICVIAAVHRAVAATLQERALAKHEWARIVPLAHDDIPVQANVKEPSRVGMDRLLNALAANRVRHPDRSAIVVDIGTAMTVNFISADGVFQGGAILAGPVTSLAALHHATASLPLLGSEALESPPPVVGKLTGRPWPPAHFGAPSAPPAASLNASPLPATSRLRCSSQGALRAASRRLSARATAQHGISRTSSSQAFAWPPSGL